MSPTSLSINGIKAIHEAVNDACSDPTRGLPCATVVLVGDGQRLEQELLEYQIPCSGNLGAEISSDNDEIYWLASCTKLVTTIAAMQLVETGLLGMDDADLVERLCPELREVKVLQQDGRLVEKKRRITLRMLLSHTGE